MVVIGRFITSNSIIYQDKRERGVGLFKEQNPLKILGFCWFKSYKIQTILIDI